MKNFINNTSIKQKFNLDSIQNTKILLPEISYKLVEEILTSYLLTETNDMEIYISNNFSTFMNNTINFSQLESLSRNSIKLFYCPNILVEQVILNNLIKINMVTEESLPLVSLYEYPIISFSDFTKEYISILLSININDYLNKVKQDSSNYNIIPKNIPQFSNFFNAVYKTPRVIKDGGDKGFTFNEIGYFLTEYGKKPGAYKKYGENHSKFAELLDFVYITKGGNRKIFLTELGKQYLKLDKDNQSIIVKFQCISMYVIKDILNKREKSKFDLLAYLENHLSYKTALRRQSNINKILNLIDSH